MARVNLKVTALFRYSQSDICDRTSWKHKATGDNSEDSAPTRGTMVYKPRN